MKRSVYEYLRYKFVPHVTCLGPVVYYHNQTEV
jgi:hypothetical protein